MSGGKVEMATKLDDSLITSDVCIKCGHCCKWTSEMQSCHPVIGPEWLNVIAKQSDKTHLKWYENETEDHLSKSENKVIREDRARFKIQFTCPKLEIDEEAGTKICTIYEDRPKVCSNYNCFRNANNLNQRPENWNYIKGIIKEVHGVDVNWDGPLTSARIKLKEIK